MSGKVLKGFLIGAAFIGASFIPGLGAVAGVTLKSLFLHTGIGLVTGSLSQALSMGQRQRSVLQNASDPQARLPVAYGQVRLGLQVADYRVGGSHNKYLYIVGALCHGSDDGSGITSIDDIYLDERLAVAADGAIQSWLDGKLSVVKYYGTDAQDVGALTIGGSTLRTLFPDAWGTTSRGRGIAGLLLRLEFDPEVFPSGIPNITAVVRGNRVKNPADLEAPALYSTNPAHCVYDYLTSTRYGCKQAEADVDATSFASMAAYYDTTVQKDTTSGTLGLRFTCNGWLDTGQPWRENLRQLLSSCRGTVIRQGGQWRIITRRAATPTAFALTEDNLVGDWSFSLPDAGQSPNLIRGSYVEPGAPSVVDGVTYAPPHAVAQRIWPRPGATNDYLTADKGHQVVADVSLPFTSDPYTTEQILLVTLKELRSAKSVGVTATEEALQLQIGDLVPLTHATPGWTTKYFWVMGVFLIQETKLVRLVLMEYDPAAYSLDPLDTIPPAPDTNLPNPFAVAAPTELFLLSDAATSVRTIEGVYQPAISVGWVASTDPYVDYYELEAKPTAGDTFVPFTQPTRDSTSAIVSPVAAYESWDVRIRAVNTLGRRSAWLSGTVVTDGPPPSRRPEVGNLAINGNGEQGAIGVAAPGWSLLQGEPLVVASNDPVVGVRCLQIVHPGA